MIIPLLDAIYLNGTEQQIDEILGGNGLITSEKHLTLVFIQRLILVMQWLILRLVRVKIIHSNLI